ncbi:aminoacylase 1-like protein 2 [Dichomitus squalens]|uniref:Peptidase M20 domain-containing protein 2 n=1 Tax=Dichomitus squalens TaxID=114155 RepID=A0A4Q9PYW7_9APHY|nr:aminoacylase 1-like protein 2 [Dichomitus squalens]TBU46187.1 aminoacylase 1-like protein 2 [Dichomitus squalens]TBU59829.1 aminoacylase 1-like protein 2 [Dichomitus squalens]
MAQGGSTVCWQPGDKGAPLHRVDDLQEGTIYRPELFEHVQATLKSLDQDLFELSKDIHDHPELRFEERHAHDILTAFVERHGFDVTRHHLLETAWVAKSTRGTGGRTLGVNSEMDALPGIGHACGHNLIAIAGVAVAIAVKSAMEKFDISGSVVLLGTPAEEGGSGKAILLEQGAYEGMDACLMCHPAPGPRWSASLSSCLALQRLIVEFSGHTAHAALSPWEGQNALDAAVLAYTNISVLRQQLKPSHRVHGIFEGKDWAPNIIPDYSKMTWYVRAPTRAEVEVAVPRVTACFEAAGLATGCKVKLEKTNVTYDLRQNKALSDECADIFLKKFGPVDYEYGIKSASTDFGNVTYVLPSLHPSFAIPTKGSNHTPEFTEAAATKESHQACINMSITLSAIGLRLLTDDAFAEKVKKTFDEDKRLREAAAAQA